MGCRRRAIAAGAVLVVLAGIVAAVVADQAAQAAPFDYQHLNRIQKRLVSGYLAAELGPEATPSRQHGDDSSATGYRTTARRSCSGRRADNVKVNQNCLNLADPDLQGRGQANNEAFIAQDRYHPKHLLASDNDYRRGDGTCGVAYSHNRGASWHDATVPNGFSRGDTAARQYWQASGDTSVAWDTRDNAYLACQVFNRGSSASTDPDQSSGFLIFRSTGNSGASFDFPGRYAAVTFDPQGTGTTGPLLDKELLTVDNYRRSPYRDRVYVTWTSFAADGTAYIYESHSSDYGETFSNPVVVSTNSALCRNSYGVATPHGRCTENQFSDPFVGPDGSLYVVWANFNNAVTGNDNRNQLLLARSIDGGRTFGAPVKVGDYYDLPDCQTYQGDDPGRSCVPEQGPSTRSVFRATNYPSGSVDPRNPHVVAVSYGSYLNRHSKESNGCVPDGFSSDTGLNLFDGVKTPGACNNDILVSVSRNGGTSFTGTHTDPRRMPSVTQRSGDGRTDQFWQWSAFTTRGVLAVSYLDRKYGRDERTGASDISLSGSRDLVHFGSRRVTSSSMPPPTQFYGTHGGLFYGDYNGLAAGDTKAFPVWSDTRDADLFLCPDSARGPHNPPRICRGREPNGQIANDQNIYTARVTVPTGR